MRPKQFCIQIIILSFILQFSIILINVVVDPYDLFGFIDIHRKKIVAINNLKLRHALYANLKNTEILFLGSSTALSGYAPHYSIPNMTHIYNAGLPGANIFEVKCYFQHFVNTNPIKVLFLNLDFFMFNANRPRRPDFDETVLNLSKSSNIMMEKFSQTLKFLASAQTLVASKKIFYSSYDTDVELFPNGFLERSKKQVYEKGHRYLFDQELKSEREETYKNFSFQTSNFSTFSHLQDIFKVALNHQVKVYVIISPLHKEHNVLLKEMQVNKQYSLWKNQIQTIIHQMNSIAPLASIDQIEFWDFSSINGITDEIVPETNNHSSMKYFWDSMHFKYVLGDLMLKKILTSKI